MKSNHFIWPSVPLAQLCDIKIGRTPDRGKVEYWGPGYPWLSIADMEQGKDLFVTKETITQKAVDECRCYQVQPDTLLMSFKLSVGKLGFARIPMYTNEAIAALLIRHQTKILPNYLYYALQVIDLMSGTDRAVMGRTLNIEKLSLLPIPLPTLTEQKRIAAILEKADRLRHQRHYASELGNTYLQSVFLEMFYEKAEKDWPNVSIESLAQRKKDAIRTGPFGSQLLHSEFVDRGIAVLGIDNAVQNRFSWGVRRFITEEKYQQLKRYTVFPGDVIITIMGTPGRCAVIPDNFPLAINTKHLCCITLDQDLCLSDYLKFCFLTHPSVLSQLKVWEHGAVMPGLNMDIIKNLVLPHPPIPRQKKFIEIVHKFEILLDQQREAERQAEHLFQTLLHQAFEGDVGLGVGIGQDESMKSSVHFSVVNYRLNGTSKLMQKMQQTDWHQPELGLSTE